VRFKKTDLLMPQVLEHINNGGTVDSIDLGWDEKVTFSLSHSLLLKKIKLQDAALQGKGESETQAERFDADFALFTGIMAELVVKIQDWFGGKAAA
jgi:recombination associated protein RdgC